MGRFLAALEASGVSCAGYAARAFRLGREALRDLVLAEGWAGRVIVAPAFTCPVVVEALIQGGAEPLLVDAHPETFHMDGEALEPSLPWSRVAAVLAGHTLGSPMRFEPLRARLRRLAGRPVPVIEDAAHALGARVGGRPLQWSGDHVLLSLYKQCPNPAGAVLLSRRPLPENLGWDGAGALLDRAAAVLPRLWERRPPAAGDRPGLAALLPASAVLQRPEEDGEQSRFALNVLVREEGGSSRDALWRKLRQAGFPADRLWFDAPVSNPRWRRFLHGPCPVARTLIRGILNVSTPRLG